MGLLLSTAALAQTPAPLVADATPLPLYLGAEQVQAVLAKVDWTACAGLAGTEDVTASLSFQISADGGVHAPRWASTPSALAECWTQTLLATSFGAHAEETLDVSWTMALRRGTVFPYPVVTITARDLGPLFLYVPPDATPEQRRALRRVLQAQTLATP
jgi:hypothetical protein